MSVNIVNPKDLEEWYNNIIAVSSLVEEFNDNQLKHLENYIRGRNEGKRSEIFLTFFFNKFLKNERIKPLFNDYLNSYDSKEDVFIVIYNELGYRGSMLNIALRTVYEENLSSKLVDYFLTSSYVHDISDVEGFSLLEKLDHLDFQERSVLALVLLQKKKIATEIDMQTVTDNFLDTDEFLDTDDEIEDRRYLKKEALYIYIHYFSQELGIFEILKGNKYKKNIAEDVSKELKKRIDFKLVVINNSKKGYKADLEKQMDLHKTISILISKNSGDFNKKFGKIEEMMKDETLRKEYCDFYEKFIKLY